jgi:FlaA1/EpsC-like NDP-sugar epimerase
MPKIQSRLNAERATTNNLKNIDKSDLLKRKKRWLRKEGKI